MKKYIKMMSLLMIMVFASMLFACASDNAPIAPGATPAAPVVTPAPTPAPPAPEPPAADKVPVDYSLVTPTITLKAPDSIGTVWMEAEVTNKSDYPIIGYSMTVLRKDTNEKGYLMTYDTIMPGDTSPKFETIGPATGKPEDYEILSLDLNVAIDQKNAYGITYDFKLGRAEWYEYEY